MKTNKGRTRNEGVLPNRLSKNRIVRVFCIGDVNAGNNNVVPFSPRRQPLKIFLPDNLAVKTADVIVLRVVGNSLQDARIYDGDYLICKRKFELSEIRQDTICAVLILSRNEVVAKRVRLEKDTVILKSANGDYADCAYPADEIEICGIAIGGAFYFV